MPQSEGDRAMRVAAAWPLSAALLAGLCRRAVAVGGAHPAAAAGRWRPWPDLSALLTGPDPLAIMIALLLAVAWVAWLIFAARRGSAKWSASCPGVGLRLRLPGLPGCRDAAAGRGPVGVGGRDGQHHPGQLGGAPSSQPSRRREPPAPEATRDGEPAAPDPAQSTRRVATPAGRHIGHRHARANEEDRTTRTCTWSSAETTCGRLAQRYYGQGSDWRRIAAANPDTTHRRAGSAATSAGSCASPAWIEPTPIERSEGKADRDSDRRTKPRKGRVRTVVVQPRRHVVGHRRALVRRGASAGRSCGGPTGIQLDDPDELLIGMRLVVPTLNQDRSVDGEQAEPKPIVENRSPEPTHLPLHSPVGRVCRHGRPHRAARRTGAAGHRGDDGDDDRGDERRRWRPTTRRRPRRRPRQRHGRRGGGVGCGGISVADESGRSRGPGRCRRPSGGLADRRPRG